MKNLVSISDLDLTTVTGGLEGQFKGDLGRGYVGNVQGSFASQDASRQNLVREACTNLNTNADGSLDKKGYGQCLFDHSK
jgi:hypothetical protein